MSVYQCSVYTIPEPTSNPPTPATTKIIILIQFTTTAMPFIAKSGKKIIKG